MEGIVLFYYYFFKVTKVEERKIIREGQDGKRREKEGNKGARSAWVVGSAVTERERERERYGNGVVTAS